MSAPPDFDRLYAADPDPWQVATSWYEIRKINLVASTLRRQRYRQAWDAACGTGALAERLAPRCDALLATDLSGRAVDLTARLLAHLPTVRTAVSALPQRPRQLQVAPDLIILSEVLYYLDAEQRQATYALVDAVAAPDADVVAVHWTPAPESAHVPGVTTHLELGEFLLGRGWGRLISHTDVEFVISVFSRDLPESIGR